MAALGLYLIATSWPSVVRRQGEQARADIHRALTPIATVAAEQFTDGRDRQIHFSVPDDDQWRRIRRRMGQPDFVIVLATDPEQRNPVAYSATKARVSAQVTVNGRSITVTSTGELPWNYAASSDKDARKFRANPSDAVSMSVRLSAPTLPHDARLMIFPIWNGLETWDWLDGTAMGQGLAELLAPYLVGLGCLMILLAVFVGRSTKNVLNSR
jgi:hypothetical protein